MMPKKMRVKVRKRTREEQSRHTVFDKKLETCRQLLKGMRDQGQLVRE